MYVSRPKHKSNMDEQMYGGAPMRNGLSVDSRYTHMQSDGSKKNSTPFLMNVDTAAQPGLDDAYGSQKSPRTSRRASPQQSTGGPRRTAHTTAGIYGARGSLDTQQHSMQARGPMAPSGGQAELNPVTAWGIIAGSSGSSTQRSVAAQRSPPPGRIDRGARMMRSQTTDSAVDQAFYHTPPTAHRPSISTVLSAGTHSANGLNISGGAPLASTTYENAHPSTTPRMHNRSESISGTPLSRRYSHAEFDTFSDRSFAAPSFGFGTQSSRPNLDDPSMYAHTPARDTMLAAMHVMGRNPMYSAGADYRHIPSTQSDLMVAPESPSLSHRGATRSRRHSRVSSLVSPTTRARRIEDTQNALTSGIRASTNLGHVAQPPADGMPRRPNAAQTWYAPHVAAPDALSDTYAWGAPGIGRARAGSVALSNASAAGRRSFQEHPQPQARGNGLATEAATRHVQRASYASSVQGSHGASMVGSTHNHYHRGGSRQPIANRSADAGSSFVSASARKARHQSAQPKNSSKTPIRSNWYHKEEMMSDSDIKDQEFVSSDEEDFDKEGKRYGGDMVAQQKLIQKQQRAIFDLNMRCKMLANAMNSKTKEPYEALVDDFGRTCASNRRANREIELMREEVQGLKERCAYLEEATANPPQCALPHGMSEQEHAVVEGLKQELEDARRALEVETSVTRQKQSMLDELNSRNGDLQEQLTRVESSAVMWYRTAMNSKNASPTSSNAKHGEEDGRVVQNEQAAYGLDFDDAAAAAAAAANNDPLAYRVRAGTATTTSETLTLRALSDGSAGVEEHRRRASNAHSPKVDSQEKARLESVIEVLKAEKDRLDSDLKQSEAKCVHLEDELKQTKKRMREHEEQRRLLQLEMKHNMSSRMMADGKSSKDEIAQLIDENEALKDECDSLRRQVDDARDEIRTHTETALAAVSSLNLESDEDMGGSSAQRAEIAKLKVECNDSKQQAKMLEEHVGGLTEELERSHEQLRRLCHDMVRPYLRESTVAPTMAESVFDQIRQWSELKVVVPPANNDDRATPTKSSEAGNNYRSMGHGRFGSINSNAASPPPPLFRRFNTGSSLGYGSRISNNVSEGNPRPAGSSRQPLPSYTMD
ncbi:hypothetical protein IW140_002980 [Coemansia sp. RSA 1813]|nr:hypothetical protein EV178_003816 [Coemansia sp. RSA 1646]KAJ1770592.1 hypothetical protein LPJ74_003041 [Coemansia sp. RSA 1843]KAJ2091409.1 hypothetical protein IW138_001868 [Coemansia sp. RSA 986]KAJ2212834.1 hypothetical protein EV179_004321 [Coemansia sp. RSA 487]KAJ2569572.1 hypothetical protein IW140_002980 [Coemansia sp. RSA 1813]